MGLSIGGGKINFATLKINGLQLFKYTIQVVTKHTFNLNGQKQFGSVNTIQPKRNTKQYV